MNQAIIQLEYNQIMEQLEGFALTPQAKKRCRELVPSLSEQEVIHWLRDTTEARILLDACGMPPLVSMKDMTEILKTIEKEGILSAEQLEYVASCLVAIRRIKQYLEKGKYLEIGLAYYSDSFYDFDGISEEINAAIRNGRVDDYASKELKEIRRNQEMIREKVRLKLESMLRGQKECFTESFISNRNGHFCLPVKTEYKFRISGSVIDKSTSGATLFIEPTIAAKYKEELSLLEIEEENEERKIRYMLSGMIADVSEVLEQNLSTIEALDFMFAKGKLSCEIKGIAPNINTDRYICIKQGRHPLLPFHQCIPLDFEIGKDIRGIVITGPNTGGKTVAIKTVGLLSMMAQSGLHVPCEQAEIAMNSQILCDIGDNQSITQNLSTFSAHIKNVIDILKCVNQESLVILDELGSGTDPAEGMGIAVAILEELRKRKCLFLATTHYPEIKEYARKAEGLINARMLFDKETFCPIYQLEIGEAGQSCALSIAKRLGMPDFMIERAFQEAYGREEQKEKQTFIPSKAEVDKKNSNENPNENRMQGSSIRIQKKKEPKPVSKRAEQFQIGDSVLVFPEKKIGIVYEVANINGEVGVQVNRKKRKISHKRLKLHVSAKELYPEDYDFSILFDSVENRKNRHKMEKKHMPGLEIKTSCQTNKRSI